MRSIRIKQLLALLLCFALFVSACTSDTTEEAVDTASEPAAEATKAEEPAKEEPAKEEPAKEEPKEEEPAKEEPAKEEPAAEETKEEEPKEEEAKDDHAGHDHGDVPAGCIQDYGITETAPGEITYTQGPGNWNGYNGVTSRTYTVYNSVINGRLSEGFAYYGVDGNICNNTAFGTYELISEDPMILSYKINDEVVWSDGTPVTYNDVLLNWAAQNPEFLAPGYASGENEEAEPVFAHVSTSFAQRVPEGPKGEINSKEYTLEFADPYPDYKLFGSPGLPAHVVAEQIGLTSEELMQAILDEDVETVKKAAEFWNDGWVFDTIGELPDDSLIPSFGPYKIKQGSWTESSITLEANPNYWGTPPATELLTFRFIDDAQMTQALENKEANAISPSATIDTVKQLEALGDTVVIGSNSVMTWEHLDFNFREENIFSDANGGHALREAFAYCAPRQTIVDNLLKPISPSTVVMNARERMPFQGEAYEEIVSHSYDGRYDQVDIEKAKELIASTGMETPIDVRIGYKAGNQRRSDTVATIAAVCKDAGFNIIDAGVDTFFSKELNDGDWDIALFAWAGSGQIASGQNIYSSNRPQNNGHYSNPVVDEAWEVLATTLDEQVQLEQVRIIEKTLWDDLFNLPLYSYPGVTAWDADLKNVRPTATQAQLAWNSEQWAR